MSSSKEPNKLLPTDSPMKAMQICFMIYDSRSGSTLLARKLAEELEDVAVTPEIGFDSLFRRTEASFSRKSALEVVKQLYFSGDFRNIGIERSDMEAAVMEMSEPITPAELVHTALGLWSSTTGSSASRIVVKNGTHAKYWQAIKRIWQNQANIIFVFRDPRAVINSKLRTVRPYHAHEVMAWGGPLLAAWRWRSYSVLMRLAAEAGVCVLDVKYEELLASTEIELAKIAAFIGTTRGDGKTAGKYKIPVAEREIHTLVTAGEIRQDRSEAWMNELSSFDCAVIESSCRNEMVRRGYVLTAERSHAVAWLYLLVALPAMAMKVVRHFVYPLFRHDK